MKEPVIFKDSQLLAKALQQQIFHFTSADSLFAILKDLTLKMTPCSKLNDLNEGNIKNFEVKDSFKRVELVREIETNCYVSSFSESYQVQGKWISGVNRPNMWAYYARSMSGACVVLNREKFLEINKELLSRYFHKYGDIEYNVLNASLQRDIDTKDFDVLLEQHSKELFFTKHISWSQEDEWRLMLHSKVAPEKLSIDGCIEYIVLGEKFLEGTTIVQDKHKKNSELLINFLRANKHDCFSPYSFALFMHSSSGYSQLPASGHKIFDDF
jgi:hypothetical protein